MNFKKSKEEVINNAQWAAKDALQNAITNIKFNGYNNSQINVLDTLEAGIAHAIGQAIRSIVEDTYTDQEFEEDLMLRDKT